MIRPTIEDVHVELLVLAIVLYAFSLVFFVPALRPLILESFVEFQQVTTGGFSTTGLSPGGSVQPRPLEFGYTLVFFGTLSLALSLLSTSDDRVDEWERDNL